MKIACNYYPEVEQLLNENIIDLDYVKFPSIGKQCQIFNNGNLSEFEKWLKEKNTICPIMIHGLGPTFDQIGSENFKGWLNQSIAKTMINASGLNGISLHLCGVNTSYSREQNKKIILDNIRFLKELFPDIEFLEFENVDGNPFRNRDKFGVCIEPDFIHEIIHEAKVNFLLDISHAYCSAKCLGMDLYEYIDRLPLDKVWEIHINGWADTGTDIMAHIKITEEAYIILDYVLDKCTPEIITIEYGREDDRINLGTPVITNIINDRVKDEIIEQVNRIRTTIESKIVKEIR